jgi:hypothetical protein
VHLHRGGAAPGPVRAVVRPGRVQAAAALCDVGLIDEDDGVRLELLGVELVLRPDLATPQEAMQHGLGVH